MPPPNNPHYLRSQPHREENSNQQPVQPPQQQHQAQLPPPPPIPQQQLLPPPPPIPQQPPGQLPPHSSIMANRIQLEGFAGKPSDRGDIWWEYFERYATLSGFGEDRRLDLLPFFLSRHAKVWFDALPVNLKDNYATLRGEFLKRFSGQQAKFDIYGLCQGGGESCAEYYTRCQQAMLGKGYPDNIQVMTVIRGLQPAIQRQVMLKSPQTMEEARAAMELVEMAGLQSTVAAVSTPPDPMWKAIEELTASVNALQTKSQSQDREQRQYQHARRDREQRQNQYARGGRNNTQGCIRCNYPYFHSLDNGGAKGIRCTKCNGLNHFSDLCRRVYNK